jgi:hypothetical protein
MWKSPPAYRFSDAMLAGVDASDHLVDGQNDGQPHGGLGSGQHDDEKREDLAGQPPRHIVIEGHQVDVGAIENQFDAHEHGHGIASGEHGHQAETEEQAAHDQKMAQ